MEKQTHIINCPRCKPDVRLDEREFQDGELIKKKCPNCKKYCWALGELSVKVLCDLRDDKEK